MTGNPWLDWVLLAVSLFNTILLVWLGVTVLLNTERRNWGVWLAGIGLLVASAFFISHTALVSEPLFPLTPVTDFWWHAGWGPVILAPLSWYIMVLWYAGYWDDPRSALSRRHRPWLAVLGLFTVTLVVLLLFGNPLPTITSLYQQQIKAVPAVAGVPLLILAYPAFIVLCIGLALDALLRPGPSGRFMGDQARRRARPWLMATSLVLIAVSILVGWVMLWLYELFLGYRAPLNLSDQVMALGRWDMIIAALIGAAILLLGQAIVSYEIFTGRTLPRRGFLRQWQNAIILAADVSVVVAAGLIFHLSPVYSLLITILLLTVFYALFSWRTAAEREQLTVRLRPFVTSQRMYEHLLEGESQEPARLDAVFAALCGEVLDARQACLAALGPLAPLAGPPLVYPAGASLELPDFSEISRSFAAPGSLGLPLDPRQSIGMAWAVPLWNERGLIGVLLLGEKRGGGFYTEEEIEIARASGERLVDNQATAEIARRLIALQRQRLAESQVLDRQTRRVLHDDVLPLLHAALLGLSSAPSEQNAEAVSAISQAHRQVSDLLHDLPAASDRELSRLGLVEALRGTIETEFRSAFDEVIWQVDEEAARRARSLPPLPTQVLFHAAREAARNAARHARRGETGESLRLSVTVQWQDGLVVRIEDNGGGLRPADAPGETGGSGQGLALHSTMMAVAGGTLSLESSPDCYTRVILSLPSEAC